MNDLEIALIEAWHKHRSRILSDPAEMQRRLGRRRSAVMLRPPRAWCVGVRASDTRIDPFDFACVPEDAAYPANCRADRSTAHYARHTVDLTAAALRKICRPVRIERPGQDHQDVAKLLGRGRCGLHHGRATGVFHNHYVPLLGGKPGKPIPIIYADRLFDPSAGSLASRPDPIWGSIWQGLADLLPDDFSQTLTRVPVYRSRSGRAFDPDRPSNKQPSPRIPPPPPDYVWYKWKNGEFHDPHRDLHPRRPHRKSRDANRESKVGADPCRFSEGERDSASAAAPPGRPQFSGWKWLCPACKKRVRMVYYPLPAFNLLQYLGEKIRVHEADELQTPPPTFACLRCHRIRYFSALGPKGWNELVAQLSGGLLYGHEVPKPESFNRKRRRPFRAHLRRLPSARRQQVLELLLAGKTYRQIARELGIGFATVHDHVKELHRQHNVHNLGQLCQRLNVRKPLPPRALEVFHRLLAGDSKKRIAAGMRCTLVAVSHHLQRIYRYYNVHSRRQLLAAVGASRGRKGGFVSGRRSISAWSAPTHLPVSR